MYCQPQDLVLDLCLTILILVKDQVTEPRQETSGRRSSLSINWTGQNHNHNNQMDKLSEQSSQIPEQHEPGPVGSVHGRGRGGGHEQVSGSHSELQPLITLLIFFEDGALRRTWGSRRMRWHSGDKAMEPQWEQNQGDSGRLLCSPMIHSYPGAWRSMVRGNPEIRFQANELVQNSICNQIRSDSY